jgi:NAD-dependent deacetylase
MGNSPPATVLKLKKTDRLVVLTGAGISAESGISTFRDKGGLWEQFSIEEVATPEAWQRAPQKVLGFYNQRIRQMKSCQPNEAHLALAKLATYCAVEVITQNVDDLHERAGSERVLHLHGQLNKARSSVDPSLGYELRGEIPWGATCAHGKQLRPKVVWFGEPVPAMEEAQKLVDEADYLLVIGTSLQVYPAAGLVRWAPHALPKLIIDPSPELGHKGISNITHWPVGASDGMRYFITQQEAAERGSSA